MSRYTDHALIAVATSIPPKVVRQDEGRSIDDEYQELCIQSWIDAGFRILSVNHPEEVEALAARYPEVNFVPADRNASVWTGRKNPYLADLLLALNDAPEPVLGIINADIAFEPSPTWQTHLPSLVDEALVVGHRYDATSLRRGVFLPHYGGLDCFFFDKSIARKALEHAMPFAMGLPWWDYWLPCLAALEDRRILVVGRPSVVHLAHPFGYSGTVFREFGYIFANFVTREFSSARHALPEVITMILPLCREISALPRRDVISSEEHNDKLLRLCHLFMEPICANVVRFNSNELPPPSAHLSNTAGSLEPSATLDSALTVDNVFKRFDQRLAAGDALLHAKRLLDKNRYAEAEPKVLAAITEAPDDFDVLLTYGKFFLRRGEFQRAHLTLNKASAQKPESTELLHLLGTALHAMDRREEEIQCYRKILRHDPRSRVAYTELALALWKTDRQPEAIACLERAIQQWPHFVRARKLHGHFLEERKRQANLRASFSNRKTLFSTLSGMICRPVSLSARISLPNRSGELMNRIYRRFLHTWVRARKVISRSWRKSI